MKLFYDNIVSTTMKKKALTLSLGIPFAIMLLFQSAWFGTLVTVSDGQPHSRWFFEPALSLSEALYFTVAVGPSQLIYFLFPSLLDLAITESIFFALIQFIFSWAIWGAAIYVCVNFYYRHKKYRV